MQIQKIQDEEVDPYLEVNNLYSFWAFWSNFDCGASTLLFFTNEKNGSISSDSRNLFLNVSYQSLLYATDGFSSINLIGVGSFGFVYKGILN